jgi:hypothetical protein
MKSDSIQGTRLRQSIQGTRLRQEKRLLLKKGICWPGMDGAARVRALVAALPQIRKKQKAAELTINQR